MCEDLLKPYAGRYPPPLRDVDVSLRDGALSMRVIFKGGFPRQESPAPPSPPPTMLALYGHDCVFVPEEPFKGLHGNFLRDARGRITHFRMLNRIHVRQPGVLAGPEGAS